MLLALRRRLRLPLPMSPHRCGPNPGRGQAVDALGDRQGRHIAVIVELLGTKRQRTAVEIYLTQKETEPEEASCPSGLDGGGKGSDRKNAKGAFGKGKGQLMAPDVKDLLHAPKPGSLNAAPKAAGISTGWSSDALLMALLPHLPQDGLPLAIQAQIGTFKQSNTALEGKQLHALVAQKSQAEKEINKIQLQRDKYERGWAQYVAQMSELFMQQLTNRFQIAKVGDGHVIHCYTDDPRWPYAKPDDGTIVGERIGMPFTEHDLLRFVVKLASPHMLCVIGHQDETIDAWWSGLRSMLMFECDGSDKQKPINRNGRHLERLLIDFELARTRPLDAFERQVVTWISPKLLESMIDYALLPQAWEANFVTLGEPDEALQNMGAVLSIWGLRQMQAGKATGFSGIPSEALGAVALQAADVLYPVLMKITIGGVAPQAPEVDPSKAHRLITRKKMFALLTCPSVLQDAQDGLQRLTAGPTRGTGLLLVATSSTRSRLAQRNSKRRPLRSEVDDITQET
ncbi:unnamed protein product, partial [Symbiodinium sp. KB8]